LSTNVSLLDKATLVLDILYPPNYPYRCNSELDKFSDGVIQLSETLIDFDLLHPGVTLRTLINGFNSGGSDASYRPRSFLTMAGLNKGCYGIRLETPFKNYTSASLHQDGTYDLVVFERLFANVPQGAAQFSILDGTRVLIIH
jgi:hypothetical protein